MKNFRLLVAALLTAPLWLSTAQAGVTIYGTRVIYNEGSREQQVRLSNEDGTPLLVQVWLDQGELTIKDAEAESVPFVVTPPIFRMSPQKGQTLRIVYTGEALPQDKESVFWLNVLEIPPKAATENQQNTLQLAIHTRIKLFFRPKTLVEGPKYLEKQLIWEAGNINSKAPAQIQVTNPSPYFVSFMGAQLITRESSFELDTKMVAPGETAVFPLAVPLPKPLNDAPEKIEFSLIDDQGAIRSGSAKLE